MPPARVIFMAESHDPIADGNKRIFVAEEAQRQGAKLVEVEVKNSRSRAGRPDASFQRTSAALPPPARLPVDVIPEPVPFLSLPALLVHIAPSGRGP